MGFNAKALKHLERMQREELLPDIVTFVCSLKACGCIAAIAQGIELHNDIEKRIVKECLSWYIVD